VFILKDEIYLRSSKIIFNIIILLPLSVIILGLYLGLDLLIQNEFSVLNISAVVLTIGSGLFFTIYLYIPWERTTWLRCTPDIIEGYQKPYGFFSVNWNEIHTLKVGNIFGQNYPSFFRLFVNPLLMRKYLGFHYYLEIKTEKYQIYFRLDYHFSTTNRLKRYFVIQAKNYGGTYVTTNIEIEITIQSN